MISADYVHELKDHRLDSFDSIAVEDFAVGAYWVDFAVLVVADWESSFVVAAAVFPFPAEVVVAVVKVAAVFLVDMVESCLNLLMVQKTSVLDQGGKTAVLKHPVVVEPWVETGFEGVRLASEMAIVL